jgi:hypothetical protein
MEVPFLIFVKAIYEQYPILSSEYNGGYMLSSLFDSPENENARLVVQKVRR